MKKKFLIIVTITIFLAVNFILIVSIPENPIKSRYPFFSERKTKSFLAQGWSFFTKNARDKEAYIYKIDTIQNTAEKVMLRNTQISQLLGIKRENRIINSKISRVVEGIDANLWIKYRGKVTEYLEEPANLKKLNIVSIKISKPSLCGLYCIGMKKPIPWSWINLKKTVYMESELILINFKCE